MTKDDSNFDLSSGRDTLEENGVQVYHGKRLPTLTLQHSCCGIACTTSTCSQSRTVLSMQQAISQPTGPSSYLLQCAEPLQGVLKHVVVAPCSGADTAKGEAGDLLARAAAHQVEDHLRGADLPLASGRDGTRGCRPGGPGVRAAVLPDARPGEPPVQWRTSHSYAWLQSSCATRHTQHAVSFARRLRPQARGVRRECLDQTLTQLHV
jgi:hypothetical protein